VKISLCPSSQKFKIYLKIKKIKKNEEEEERKKN
jgi:hypothetical protein